MLIPAWRKQQHKRGDNAHDGGGNHQPKGVGQVFGRGVDGAPCVPQRGARHHAEREQADAAHGDEVRAQTGEFGANKAQRQHHQPDGGKHIAQMQRPQHWLAQNFFMKPAFALHAAHNAGKQQKVEREGNGGLRHHQRGGGHRCGKRADHCPLRAIDAGRVQPRGREKWNDAPAHQANKARHQNQARQQAVGERGGVAAQRDVERKVAASEQE